MYLIKNIFIYVFLLFSLSCATQFNTTVKRVIDGDTVVLQNGKRLRLIGIDAPETNHPEKGVQCFGKESTNYLRKEIEGKKIKVVYSEEEKIDKYGRLLGYLYKDEKFINAELIKQGYAFAYRVYPFKYKKDFIKYQKQAKKQNKGLWKACKVTCGFLCSTSGVE